MNQTRSLTTTSSKSQPSSGASPAAATAPMPSSPLPPLSPPAWAESLWRSPEIEYRNQRYPAPAVIEAEIGRIQLWLTPCPSDRILTLLSRLRLHCPMRDMSEDHARLVIEDYLADLATVPADLLETAVVTWRRRQKWFPSIAELLAACEPDWRRRRAYTLRLRRAADTPREPEWRPPTEEEKARVSALLAESRQRWGMNRAPAQRNPLFVSAGPEDPKEVARLIGSGPADPAP